MSTEKNKGGRPRNPRLDEIMQELAVTRRHAKRILKDEQEKSGSATPMSPNPPAESAGTSIAAIRANKLLREIELLEVRVRQAALDERHQAGELLYLAEAQELVLPGLAAIANRLREQNKRLAVRLVGASLKSIETTLQDDNDRTLELCASAIARVKSGRKL